MLMTIFSHAFSQTCENYNKKLFHMLPRGIPDQINCKDILGRKQGWWIYYKVLYNDVDRPDELSIGDYVPDYEVGQYKNDLKIGDWQTIANVHQIYALKEENFLYRKDSIIYIHDDYTFKETTVMTADSSVIKSEFVFYDDIPKTACIECNKKKNGADKSCSLKYRGKLIKYFPHKDFFLENGKIVFFYEQEKNQIDNSLDH